MDPDRPPDPDDFENPYAPPDSTFAEDLSQGPFGRIEFTVGDLFNWTWSLYKERFGTCMGIIWGVVAVNLGVSIVSNLLLTAAVTAVRDPIFTAIMQFAVIFGGNVVQIWLNIGSNLALLKIVRRQEVAFEDVFTGGRYVLTTILAALLLGLAIGGPILLALFGGAALLPMIQDNPSALAVLLIVIVVGVLAAIAVYISVRLMQFYFVVIDLNTGVIESLRTSWYLTKGRVPTLILVYLLQTSIVLAGLLACIVGLIFAVPLASLLLAVTYQALAGQTPGAELQFLDSWDEDLGHDERARSSRRDEG
jgi:hypothetical protein